MGSFCSPLFIMIYLLFLILHLNFIDNFINEDYEFIETNTNKIFYVNVLQEDSSIVLSIKSKNIQFDEYYIVKNDSIISMYKRYIKAGFLHKTLYYTPYRTRFIFPLRENRFWQYKGIESGTLYKKEIETQSYIIKENDLYVITTITTRGSKVDTTLMKLNKDYQIKEIEINIPAFWNIYKLFGFNKPKLIFINNENNR